MATHLGALLATLTTDSHHYKLLTSEIFLRGGLIVDDCRKKFRNSNLEASESSRKFVERLRNYFKKWTYLAKINDTKKSIVREQFMEMLCLDLATYLREESSRPHLNGKIGQTLHIVNNLVW